MFTSIFLFTYLTTSGCIIEELPSDSIDIQQSSGSELQSMEHQSDQSNIELGK